MMVSFTLYLILRYYVVGCNNKLTSEKNSGDQASDLPKKSLYLLTVTSIKLVTVNLLKGRAVKC